MCRLSKSKKKKRSKAETIKDILVERIKAATANMKLNDYLELGIDALLIYAGTKAFNTWKGGLLGPISLRLAKADNEVAGVAGTIGLTTLGVAMAAPDVATKIGEYLGTEGILEKWAADRGLRRDELQVTSVTFMESCPHGWFTIPYAGGLAKMCITVPGHPELVPIGVPTFPSGPGGVG